MNPDDARSPLNDSVPSSSVITTNPDLERPRPGALQKLLVLWFIAAAFMLTFGRGMLGSAGWITFLFLFTVAPFLLFYGLVISTVVYVRWKKSGYVFSRWMKYTLIIFLFSIVILSLTLVDGGDTEESIKSVLTGVIGVNGKNGAGSALMNFSLMVANTTGVVIIVTLVMMLLLAFLDGRHFGRKT